ncbi:MULTISPECIES: polysaccharide deacetylase family protein [Kitasatospora]|uniref:NodB homology domain-containing protein n=1 Tax=Kitasatospora cystarginea TaxID=58350 RepID=A0ABN3ET24_9ACTN
MPDQGTTRTILRRAAAGCAALLPLALACACGPTSNGASAAASPSIHAGATASATAQSAPGRAALGSVAATTAGAPGTAAPGITVATTALPAAGAPSAATPSTPAPGPVTPGTPASGTAAPAAPTRHAPAPGTPAPAATTGPAAATAAPDAPGSSIVYRTASGGKTVALTFDDGPGPATGAILDLLKQYHAKATFCEIGPQAAANPKTVQRILDEGHRLCDHTVNHPQPMHTLPREQQVYEIDAAKAMILKSGGPDAKVAWFRAPGGDFSAQNRQIAVQDGLRPLGWTVDTRDWAKPGVPEIVATAQRELHPGGIILMHDGGGDRSQTVAALAQLLPWLVQQGYTFDFPDC